MAFVGRNAEGEFGEYEIALSDYRAVGGLRAAVQRARAV